MDKQVFDSNVERRLSATRDTLGLKGKEYAIGRDRLKHFKRMAEKGRKPRTWFDCAEMLSDKHDTSIEEILFMLEDGEIPTQELIDEKFGDRINYYILLENLVYDRIAEIRSEEPTELHLNSGTEEHTQ